MVKKYTAAAFVPLLFAISGCSAIGEKSASLSLLYGATAFLALLMLICYLCFVRNKDKWFLILFASIAVVNTGYLLLSSADTLSDALGANRLSYFGSVFLPFAMLMVIVEACGIRPSKWLTIPLAVLGVAVFLIAASPGYLDIYYSSVKLVTANGISVLDKEYGPLHPLYLYYLVGYVLAMLGVTAFSALKRNLTGITKVVIILSALLINVGVWLLEQFVEIDVEMLSVSYIISALFLLMMNIMYQELRTDAVEVSSEVEQKEQRSVAPQEPITEKDEEALRRELFVVHLADLTPTERLIYNCYLAGKCTKEVLAELDIKENTLKFHNKNIYGKLGVSSRKQLVSLAEDPFVQKLIDRNDI